MDESAMDTSTTSSDDPMAAAAVDNSRRMDHLHHPALDTATRRYMDPFAHLDVRRMVESSGMDARRLAEQLYPAMNARRFTGAEQFPPTMDRRPQLQEFLPVEARRFGEQIPVANVLAANERRFDNSTGSLTDVRVNRHGEAIPLTEERTFNDQSSVMGNKSHGNDQTVVQSEKSPVKADNQKPSLEIDNNSIEKSAEENKSRDGNPTSCVGTTDKKPELSSGNPDSQPGGETDSQSYSLDFKSGTFIKSTDVEPVTPLPLDEPETPVANDEPSPVENDDLCLPKEESSDQVVEQVDPKVEEPLCLLDTKVEEPSEDLEEREARVNNLRMNYKESSDEEEISLALRRSLKKQRKSRGAGVGAGDVTKMETEDYEDSISQVDAFLGLSYEETNQVRTNQQDKYSKLKRSSLLSNILVTCLQDLQTMKEKYEDGILAFHNFYNCLTTDNSFEVGAGHSQEELDELDTGLGAMFEGLKKHVALQDFIMCSYEGKTYTAPQITSKPGRKHKKGLKLKHHKKRSKSTVESALNNTDTKATIPVKEEKREEISDDDADDADDITDPPFVDIHDISEQNEFESLDDMNIPVTVKIEDGENGEDGENVEDAENDPDYHCEKVKKERKKKGSKKSTKLKSSKTAVKVKKENGVKEDNLEEDEIEAPPPKPRPIPPPLPFDPPKPLDSYEYKGPLGRGQRREEMVKRETGVIHYCPYCPKAFKIKRGLDGHLRIHRATQPLECDVCGDTFKKLRLLEDHKRIHSDETPYECELCNKKFRTKRSINDHRRTHTDERRFKCDQCFMAFRQLGHLNVHLKIHSGEKPYSCDQCDKAFVTKTSLRYHRMVHTGEKPLTCDECGQGFTHRGQLRNHMMHHTGERPFQCDQCSKGFIRKMELVHHMRVHTGERPYKCDVCFNAFTHKHILENHYRIHTGAKPYECDICGHKSRQRGDSLKHKAKMHKDHVAQPQATTQPNSNSNS